MRKLIDITKLYQLYIEEKRPGLEVAKIMNEKPSTLFKRLKELGWTRPRNQRRDEYGRFIQEGQELPENVFHNHPRFKTGKTVYRKIAKAYQLPRFCYHCKATRNLAIHHIDKDRNNNDPTNLRWVCGSCHRKVEHREYLLRRDKLGRFC